MSLNLEWRYSQDNIDWQELSRLYKVAPLGDKKARDLEKSFSNSLHKCFVIESGRIVGVGRALADGVDCSYICDVAVLPDYQGRGIGHDIVARLVELSRGHRKIILYANPGRESFYKKLGFRRMSTAMAIFENPEQAFDMGLLDET